MERFFQKVIYEPTVFFETQDDIFGSMHTEQGVIKTNIPERDSLVPLARELSGKELRFSLKSAHFTKLSDQNITENLACFHCIIQLYMYNTTT